MSDIARFTVCPPLRCGEATSNPTRPLCGAVAYWEAPPPPGALPVFHCAAHRIPTDRLIGPAVILRRVLILADIQFAGVRHVSSTARAEALARLEDAVIQAGGLLNLVEITDVVGRYEPPAPPPKDRPGRPRGKAAPLTD